MEVTVTKTEMVYTSAENKVRVFKGVMMPENVEVAIKEEEHDGLKSVNRALNEAIIQSKLSGLHTVCDILSLQLDWKSPSYTSTIVMAWMEQDLSREIVRRKKKAAHWTSDELFSKLFPLLETFAYMQSRGIAHRDIKPQNLFFASDGALKLGDFGSSKQSSFANVSKTIAGTPAYLSPELKRAYRNFLVTGEASETYDAFKADVYALGVTFLQMALLELPRELVIGELTRDVVSQLVMGVEGENLRWVIWRMIDPDFETRPDFVTLWNEVNSMYQSQSANAHSADSMLPSVQDEGYQGEAAGFEQKDKSGPSSQAVPDIPSQPSEPSPPRSIPERSPELSYEQAPCDAEECQKDCLQCGQKFIKNGIQLPLPIILQAYEPAVPQICSVTCFKAYRHAIEGESRLSKSCMQCSTMFNIHKNNPVMLPCDPEHGFDTLDCFTAFLVRQTESFKKPLRVSCLKCGRGIEETFVYRSLGGEPAFQSLVSKYTHLCDFCHKSSGSKLSCSHVICTRCLSGKSRLDCQVCPKCMKETPYSCDQCGTLRSRKLTCGHYVCPSCGGTSSVKVYCDWCQETQSPVKHH